MVFWEMLWGGDNMGQSGHLEALRMRLAGYVEKPEQRDASHHTKGQDGNRLRLTRSNMRKRTLLSCDAVFFFLGKPVSSRHSVLGKRTQFRCGGSGPSRVLRARAAGPTAWLEAARWSQRAPLRERVTLGAGQAFSFWRQPFRPNAAHVTGSRLEGCPGPSRGEFPRFVLPHGVPLLGQLLLRCIPPRGSRAPLAKQRGLKIHRAAGLASLFRAGPVEQVGASSKAGAHYVR